MLLREGGSSAGKCSYIKSKREKGENNIAKTVTQKISPLKKKVAEFTLVGKAQINDKYTYTIDEQSKKSDWISNVLNLGVDCGEKHGVVYVSGRDGYGKERGRNIYVHGRDEDGRDDWNKQFTVKWSERFNEDILKTVGNQSMFTAALETDKDGKLIINKFLTQYDMIAYVKEHLQQDMLVRVGGEMNYDPYNGSVIAKKNIKYIYLHTKEVPYTAEFKQTVFLDRDSLGDIDRDKGVVYLDAYIPEYVGKYNGKDIKETLAFKYTFEFPIDINDREKTTKIVNSLLKVKKNVTEITFRGEFIEGGTVVQGTLDDLPDDIKEAVKKGWMPEEEALADCVVSGNKERRMVLIRPDIRIVKSNVDDTKVPVLQKFEDAYTEEEIITLDHLDIPEPAKVEIASTQSNNTVTEAASDNSWLDLL